MFGIGMPELIVILVIALIVIGPQKLPEIARSLGKGLAEFKRASDDFQRNLAEENREQEEQVSPARKEAEASRDPAEEVKAHEEQAKSEKAAESIPEEQKG